MRNKARTTARQLISKLLRLFFRWLYHPLAWTYDGVAAVVSVGRWRDWVLAGADLITGPAVLEVGHGPGHLLVALRKRGLRPVGLDASWQMSRLARRRLFRLMELPEVPALVSGYAQSLPFPDRQFDQIVATFPTEFIWDPHALAEFRRTLKPGGTLITLPAAWIDGQRPLDRAARWLFRITGQAPTPNTPHFKEQIQHIFSTAGFQVHTHCRSLQDSTIFIVTAINLDKVE